MRSAVVGVKNVTKQDWELAAHDMTLQFGSAELPLRIQR